MTEILSVEEGLQALASKTEITKPNSGSEPILFVDDNEMILELGVTILEDLGYQVKGASGATQAVQELVNGFKPQLMCCDIVIPGGMNGVELSRKVVELMPDIKVLLISGYGADLMDGAINQDGFRLMSKPFTADDLGSRVRNILDGVQ